ncbi:MAG: PhnE/PtxC family ABC transporter permease [Verrucomicrobiales bacterium]
MASRIDQTIGRRRLLLIGIAAAGVIALWQLGIGPREMIPSDARSAGFAKFFLAALTPAIAPETIAIAARAALTTLRFAALATAISVIGGLVLGFLGSTAWWPPGARGNPLRLSLLFATRGLITFMRSVHELLWAVLFLTAIGFSATAGVIAIAIPFTGTFAKIFSEMIDEAPRSAADALSASGATPLRVYLFGLLPLALPDILAYILYRFECALRASAVIGFFGIPTLGQYIKLAFQDLNYPVVWTYLYVLIAMVIVFDLWSGSARRRIAH